MTERELVELAAMAILSFERWCVQPRANGRSYPGDTAHDLIMRYVTDERDFYPLAYAALDRATELRGGPITAASRLQRRTPSTTLTPEQRARILADYGCPGFTIKGAARRYGVSERSIYRVVAKARQQRAA